MNIEIELPADIAQALEEKWGDLSQYATKIVAVEAYRSGILTEEQLHRMLSVRTRIEFESFLAEHGFIGASYETRSDE